jgi:hypothetical protein
MRAFSLEPFRLTLPSFWIWTTNEEDFRKVAVAGYVIVVLFYVLNQVGTLFLREVGETVELQFTMPKNISIVW